MKKQINNGGFFTDEEMRKLEKIYNELESFANSLDYSDISFNNKEYFLLKQMINERVDIACASCAKIVIEIGLAVLELKLQKLKDINKKN